MSEECRTAPKRADLTMLLPRRKAKSPYRPSEKQIASMESESYFQSHSKVHSLSFCLSAVFIDSSYVVASRRMQGIAQQSSRETHALLLSVRSSLPAGIPKQSSRKRSAEPNARTPPLPFEAINAHRRTHPKHIPSTEPAHMQQTSRFPTNLNTIPTPSHTEPIPGCSG